MKKILITAAVLLTAFAASAQDKKLNAIKQLFETGKYSECIESVKKYNASNSSKPETFYYMGFSYFEVYKQNPAKESNLTLAENTVYKAVTKDKTGEVLQNFVKNYDELHQTMRQLQEKYFASGDKSKAGQHAQMSARIYKDTTEIYRRIFQPELFVVPVTQGKTLAAYEGETNQTDVTGRKQGVWIEKFPNGKRKSQINYENGKPKGDFYKFYQRGGGVKAHLYFFNDSLASAIHYAENGDKVAMGYYYNHKKDSLWQYFEADSILVSEENYVRGIKHGKQSTYYLSGILFEEMDFKNGKQDGVWKRYYESTGAPIFETYYKDGKRDGKYIKYDINGEKVISGNYKNDLKDGVWSARDEETKKVTRINYINGVPENDAELQKEETKRLEEMVKNSQNLDDPQSYINHPEDFPMK